MTPPANVDDLRRQLQAHLRSLSAAGITWVPIGTPLQSPAPIPMAVETPQAPVEEQPSLPEVAEPVPPHAPQPSIEQRRIALAQLAVEVSGCTRCPELCSTRTQTVFGQGEPGVELCFVGEAPGEDEDRQGLPFVGAAGQLLNRIITGCGLKREEVYIMNILRCRPPRNRTPLPNEAANCRGFLERQMDLVAPKFICALGGCAATNLLQTTLSIGKLRGRFHDYRGIPVLVTYHPAFLLPHRSPEKKREVWEDMQILLRRMGRPIPVTR
jgi:uracil-DNA glycosylase family 4